MALAILAAALTILLRGAAANIANTQRAQLITAVTELARGKLYDIEETLLEEGFSQTEQELDGDFDEEGWPTISWRARVLTIEMPNLDALQTPSEDIAAGNGDDEGATTGDYEDAGMIGQMLSQFGGGSGVETLMYETLRNVFAEAIRKVVLTVTYSVAGQQEEFTVDVYFTNPAAVNRVLPGGAAGGGGGSGAGSSAGAGANNATGGVGRGNVLGGRAR